MKKVTAFIGTASRKATFYAVQEFEKNLKRYEDVDFEYVFLNDYRLEFCCGCKVCFDKGEQYCPLKDDRDILIEKIEQSDGIIFATPSYTYQVSARMKNLFDRMAFIFHRPRFFGKAFTAILTQGVPVGDNIRRYIEETGGHLGFTVTRGCSLWTLDPMTESQRESLERKVSKTAARFYRGLIRSTPPVPSFFRLMLFRTGRSGQRYAAVRYYDYYYFRDKGWFESDYYYETKLGPIKRAAGALFDLMGRLIAKQI
jgi:NAD(P)H-dependent FMN reductase